jgi:hypothetical protein
MHCRQRSYAVKLCEAFLCRDRYESIHKALQYKNSEVTQMAITNESDGITMDFKEAFQCSMTPKGKTLCQTWLPMPKKVRPLHEVL